MSIVAINLADRKFELSCSQESREHIKELASQLDDQIRNVMQSGGDMNFDLALVIVALNLQDSKVSKISQSVGDALGEVNNDFQATLNTVNMEIQKLLAKLP